MSSGEITFQGDVAYETRVEVPSGSGPFPVLLCLHGSGGSNSMWFNTRRPADQDGTYIIVAPQAPTKQWTFYTPVFQTIINQLAEFDNVLPQFVIIGTSMGANMAHRVNMDINDARLVGVITVVTQLNETSYEQIMAADGGEAPPRCTLELVGGADGMIPASGGKSIGGFMKPWDDSVYAYAHKYGEIGDKKEPESRSGGSYVSYLNGRVQGVLCDTCSHSSNSVRDYASAEIQSFLRNAPACTDASASLQLL